MLYTKGRPESLATIAPAMPTTGGSVIARIRSARMARARGTASEIAAHLAAQQVVRMVFGGIVGRPAGQHGDLMALGQRFSHHDRDFRGGGCVWREILIQQKNVHG